jgi:3-dehydroquinate synthase class II
MCLGEHDSSVQVHAYTSVPDGHTKYLSELRSGDEVIVYDANGIRRTALVGRVKIERRPLVLIRAEGHGGEEYAILLQNAETVKLVGPNTDIVANNGSTAGFKTWKSISVAEMRPGDEVYVSVQAAARHTGIPIEEMILER